MRAAAAAQDAPFRRNPAARAATAEPALARRRIGPGDDLETAVLVLGERRAALHPVAAIHVADAVVVTDHGVVDVAADHAFGAVTPRFGGERVSNAPI